MAARPRKKRYQHLPEYLFFDVSKNAYRFILVSGKRKTIGSDRVHAMAVAREYNRIMRPEKIVNVDSLIGESAEISATALPFAGYVDQIMERAINDEKPASNTLADWLNDAKRIKLFFADIPASAVGLEHVNAYIKHYHASSSANVQNRKIRFLKKIFDYAVDESLLYDNPAARKKMRSGDKKKRRRLSLDDFLKIRSNAELWLRTAMDLALETTQARLEVSRIRYSIKAPKEDLCGCLWYGEPKNGIYGMLYIHRQKVKDKESSHIAIPIGDALKIIIDASRDNIVSPYVVHRLPKKTSNPISKEVRHSTQVAPDYLSRAFSALRDKLEIGSGYPIEQRPTFHEIRALAAHMFKVQGLDPQARMAHSDAKSTRIYTQNHIAWIEVPHAEINVG